MLDLVLNLVAPHLCSGCGKVGTLLCDECKYNIISEPYEQCIICHKPSTTGVCRSHQSAYQQAWCVGPRRGSLQRLIGGYKFQNMKSAYLVLADLLNATLPDLPQDVVIVPVPTVASHIRERGYDHIYLIARQLAIYRKLPLQTLLDRSNKSTQRHANKNQRSVQASKAFSLTTHIDPSKTYLVIDDIITTGATIKHAAKTLKASGARKIWVAAVARQPLD